MNELSGRHLRLDARGHPMFDQDAFFIRGLIEHWMTLGSMLSRWGSQEDAVIDHKKRQKGSLLPAFIEISLSETSTD
jgi:hypothetical protein